MERDLFGGLSCNRLLCRCEDANCVGFTGFVLRIEDEVDAGTEVGAADPATGRLCDFEIDLNFERSDDRSGEQATLGEVNALR